MYIDDRRSAIIYRFSLLIVITKWLGFKSVEFSLNKDIPIKIDINRPISKKETLDFAVGYYVIRSCGASLSSLPSLLVLKVLLNGDIRRCAKEYKEYLRDYCLEVRSVSGLIVESLGDILNLYAESVGEIRDITESLKNQPDSDLKVMLNDYSGSSLVF